MHESSEFDNVSSDDELRILSQKMLNESSSHIWKMLNSGDQVDQRLLDLYKIGENTRRGESVF